jgi:2-polyprenyl-6-methoxyphenol hydroxylase-like FAD-dependent oxidoreductase
MNQSVLVVGAGPVGMTMALASKRQGLDVRIVDKASARTDKSKALVIWPRTLELLDIQGCAEPFIDAGLKVRAARILADDKELVHVPLDAAHSVYRYALMLPQSETERLLQEQVERLGVVVERRTELITFADEGEAVSALLRRADGTEEAVHADWLVACDGAHSTVRHGLALATFDGDTLPSNWVLADLLIDGAALTEEITICFSKHGLLAFFPIGNGRFRVIADTGAATPENLPEPTLAEVKSLVDARGPAGLQLHDPIWLSRFRINERKVRDYRFGRLFLAGDAAHVHSPAGGQGMNTGMQDAMNLAWKLALVCKGQAVDALLASYSPERSGIGEQVMRNAGALTKVGLVSNPLLQQLRALAANLVDHLPALKQRFVAQMTELDLHYPDGPLTERPHGASHRPAGGERAPDLVLDGAPARRLHELLGTGRFAVLSVGTPAVVLSEKHARLALAAEVAASPHYASGHVYLIRPDAYVALSVGDAGTEAITDALDRIVASAG